MTETLDAKKKTLQELDSTKAQGPDRLSPKNIEGITLSWQHHLKTTQPFIVVPQDW